MPGPLPTSTVPPALQTAVQAPLATIADQNHLAETEAEMEDETSENMEDETSESMDAISDIDDEFDDDAVDDAEDILPVGSAEALANQPALQSYAPDQHLYLPPLQPYAPDQHHYLPGFEYLRSDDLPALEAADSDLPDLEDVLEPHETDQQIVDGSECLQHNAAQRADHPLYSG